MATQQLRSCPRHRPAKNQTQDDRCCCSLVERREEHLNGATENDDSCLRSRTTAMSTAHDDRHLHRANTSVTTCHGDKPAIRDADAEQRPVRSAWTSHGDSKVDVPAKQMFARTSNSPRDVKYNPSNGKVVETVCRDGGNTSAKANHQQSAADFATSTDQLTTNIYASLAAFQDVQENKVIDAVRGYLRRQPPPSSSRHRRPPTGRRPTTTADGDGSRTVELRQGDVGPLSSLVVIRPAIPQPRTSRATSSEGQPKTSAETAVASDDRHPALWHDSRRAQQQQQQHQRFVVRTSSRMTATCKSQSLNRSIYDDSDWFSTAHCQ